MKVRVKLAGRAQAVDVGDIEQCTLSQLQQRTADAFDLGETTFSLSLNRKDVLSGDDLTLSQLDIVPGDLLFVLGPDVPSASTSSSSCASRNDSRVAEKPQAEASGSGHREMDQPAVPESMSAPQTASEENSAMAGNDWAMSSVAEEELAAASTSHPDRDTPSPGSPCPLEDPEVNRCLQEPLLCRESTSTSVPVLLRDMFGGAGCGSAMDALWVVVHTLMLEVGFRPNQEDDFVLVSGWNRHGFYKQDYRHLYVEAQHSCSLIGVPMGQVLIVHGVANGDPPLKTDPQSLKVTDYVQDSDVSQDVCSVYKNLERLSRTVKDLICQRLMSQLSEVCGVPVTVGLLSLSYELKLKVLSYLTASSLTKVGQVCRDLNVAYRDPCLWRRLYLREFGQNGDNSLNKNWYELFTEAYQLRKERRRMARHRHNQMMSAVPPWLHLPPGYLPYPAPPLYPEGIVGGDYDLNPEFSSSIPYHFGGQPLRPDPLLPPQPPPGGPFIPHPRFDDPFGPGAGPGPPFMPQMGARDRHSSRASPFSSLGGRPRFF